MPVQRACLSPTWPCLCCTKEQDVGQEAGLPYFFRRRLSSHVSAESWGLRALFLRVYA